MNPEELAMMEQGGMPQEQPMPQEMPPTDEGELQNPELAPEQMEMREILGQDQGMPVDELMGMMSGQEEEMGAPQATEILNDVIMEFMDFVIGIKNDQQLDKQVQSKIMAEQASAISSLVPLLTNSGEMELMKARHEMDLKYQEHQMNMEMKQAELEFKKQEQQMNVEFKQQENQIKLQTAHQQSQMKLQQSHEQHNEKIVQSQEQHESKMAQQKQAAQSKPVRNPSSN
jgi:hypothetical protein